jgi:hypothetical protein
MEAHAMTIRADLLLVLLGACAGCYSGIDGRRGTADDGAADGDDGDDGQSHRLPPSDPEPVPFRVPGDEVDLLPFYVRMQNLATVAGTTLDDPMFAALYAHAHLLGDHDYAHGEAPDLRWSADKMQVWVESLEPVCDAPTFQARYPGLIEDPRALVRAAFAREATDAELEAYAEVSLGQSDPAYAYRLTCMAILSSLEFVAR